MKVFKQLFLMDPVIPVVWCGVFLFVFVVLFIFISEVHSELVEILHTFFFFFTFVNTCQGLRSIQVQWSFTCNSASGPVELSLPLVHWTSNSYEKCHVFSKPTPQRQSCVFPWPRPLCIHNEQREMTVLHDKIKYTTQATRTQKIGFEKQSPSVSSLSLLQW